LGGQKEATPKVGTLPSRPPAPDKPIRGSEEAIRLHSSEWGVEKTLGEKSSYGVRGPILGKKDVRQGRGRIRDAGHQREPFGTKNDLKQERKLKDRKKRKRVKKVPKRKRGEKEGCTEGGGKNLETN